MGGKPPANSVTWTALPILENTVESVGGQTAGFGRGNGWMSTEKSCLGPDGGISDAGRVYQNHEEKSPLRYAIGPERR